MKHKEKTLDIALLIGAAISVIIAMTTGFVKNCEEMQDKAFRLHILANSDSAEDQQIKYEVRDYILNDLSFIFSSCETKDETKALAERNISLITERINDYLKLDGCGYRAECTVGKCSFGTRKYGDYTLPAGEYDALRITLGKGEGNNWWCVLFPTLCIDAVSEETILPERELYEEEKKKAQLTADSLAARYGEVEFRFMFYEWFREFFGV
ncbi:MAG: stage II sporulation protein R [Oscillospiraceae bacterium]|nr:stage II sporulation protein R [Oscillospiraceae bacterium]